MTERQKTHLTLIQKALPVALVVAALAGCDSSPAKPSGVGGAGATVGLGGAGVVVGAGGAGAMGGAGAIVGGGGDAGALGGGGGVGNAGGAGALGGAGAIAGAGGTGGATANPLYVISTGIPSGDDFLGYLVTVPSLDASASFTLAKAIEVEPSWIFSQEGQPFLYAASLFSPTIKRFDLQADGTFKAGPTVDFSDDGVQSAYLAASAPIYSQTKSYFVDDSQDQIVIWNPSLMQRIGTIPLGDQPEGSLPPLPEGSMVLHDGKLLTAVDWSDSQSDSSIYGSHTRLHVLDPATDTIVQSMDDTRLTYATAQTESSDGTLYYDPGSYIAALAVIGPGHGSPSHVLRVLPTATVFDPTYELDLSTLVGGRPAGDFHLLDDQTAIIRVWHPELVDPVTPANWKDILWAGSEPGFLWWLWHVGDPQATQIPNQTPGVLAATVIKIDGRTYAPRTSADSSSTTLDEIDTEGQFHPGITGPGQFIGNGVLRLR